MECGKHDFLLAVQTSKHELRLVICIFFFLKIIVSLNYVDKIYVKSFFFEKKFCSISWLLFLFQNFVLLLFLDKSWCRINNTLYLHHLSAHSCRKMSKQWLAGCFSHLIPCIYISLCIMIVLFWKHQNLFPLFSFSSVFKCTTLLVQKMTIKAFVRLLLACWLLLC